MILQLGEKIKSLRKNYGRTQEALADALGITSQAVSRWEQNMAYPDMELIPAIANYFGITIDELFGYENARDKKVDEIIARINAYGIKARGDSEWVDECVSILREGLVEFPQNEKLMITLADTLTEAGWRTYHEWVYYDDEGYMQHDCDRHKNITKAIHILVLLYRNMGENEKAVSFARRMPSLDDSGEILLASATDGKEGARYMGEALLKIVSAFAEQLIYGLMVNKHNYETDMPIEKIKGAISSFYLVCEDGNFGEYHGELIKLYLYLSRVEWERGYHDEAFVSLDKALWHARALEGLIDGEEHYFTASLVSFVKCRSGMPERIAETLSDDWPFWYKPDYSQVEKEIKADPRWDEWVRKTKL